MRGTTDFAQIKLWINMLLRLKDHALEYDNPRNILELFSQTGESKFLEEIMGDYAEVLQCPQMRRMIREGVWRIQELAYTPVRDITKKKPRVRGQAVAATEDMPEAPGVWDLPEPRAGEVGMAFSQRGENGEATGGETSMTYYLQTSSGIRPPEEEDE